MAGIEIDILNIGRRRYFYKFVTPFVIKVEEEITVFNDKVIESLTKIVLPLTEFQPFLHIYDSDGEMLEFSGYQREEGTIVVYFPNNKPILPLSYRTLKMCYIIQFYPEEEKDTIIHDEKREYELFGSILRSDKVEASLTVPLSKNSLTYIFIEYSMENYNKTVDLYVLDENSIDQSSSIITNFDDGATFTHITADKDPKENNLIILVAHEIPKFVYNWSAIGLIIGTVTAIAMPLLYIFKHDDGTFLSIIVAWAIFTITALTIIKGWLFTKTWNNEILKIEDWYYRVISIWIIIITVLILAQNSLMIY